MLTAEQIEKTRADFASELSRLRREFGATKAQCTSVLVAINAWVDNNAASYNQALPVALQNHFDAKQKLQLLMLIIVARLEAM